MANQVRYLRQIVSHIEDKYGSEKAQAIVMKAQKRDDELIEANKDEPKGYSSVCRELILPFLPLQCYNFFI